MRSFALALLTTPALAETPMTGAEFDAYVTGRTLSFATADAPPYGVEQYLPNQEVIWSRGDGTCENGIWYEEADTICFVYETDPTPKCWRTYLTENGIKAEFASRPNGSTIYETDLDPLALICPGPDLLG